MSKAHDEEIDRLYGLFSYWKQKANSVAILSTEFSERRQRILDRIASHDQRIKKIEEERKRDESLLFELEENYANRGRTLEIAQAETARYERLWKEARTNPLLKEVVMLREQLARLKGQV